MKRSTRSIVKLACGELSCHHFYVTSKNKKNNLDRLVLRKYCAGCNLHAQFKETKI